jgi:hypothetical protein
MAGLGGLFGKSLKGIGGMTRAEIEAAERAAAQASWDRDTAALSQSRRPEARGMTPTRLGVPSAEKFGGLDDPKFGGGPLVGGTPEALARADEMFPVTAYRAIREPSDEWPNLHLGEPNRPEFWSASPRTANTYISSDPSKPVFAGGQMTKGRLNLGRSLEIDNQGRGYWDIRGDDIPDEVVRKGFKRGGYGPMGLARVSGDAGYDSVTLKNIIDDGPFGDGAGVPDTIYAMLDKTKRRASTAAFDPAKKDSSDLLASALLGTAAGGGALALGAEDAEAGPRVMAFRGVTKPERLTPPNGVEWFSDSPVRAGEYALGGNPDLRFVGADDAPFMARGNIDTDGFLEIDAGGGRWDSIPLSLLNDPRMKDAVRPRWDYEANDFATTATTEDIVGRAAQRGIPGVSFRNLVDQGRGFGGEPQTTYAVIDPTKRTLGAIPLSAGAAATGMAANGEAEAKGYTPKLSALAKATDGGWTGETLPSPIMSGKQGLQGDKNLALAEAGIIASAPFLGLAGSQMLNDPTMQGNVAMDRA